MESNRGGPLTTFIMTLPMIVVPAIAMLKPADSGSSLVSSLLSAGEDASSEADFGDSPDFGGEVNDVDAMFFEEPPAGENNVAAPGEGLVDEFDAIFGADLGNSFDQSQGPPANSSTDSSRSVENISGGHSAGQLHAELQSLGVMKTLWFSPDGNRQGFVAFFPVATENGPVQYRFEAIGPSRDAALRDVVRQVRQWLATQQ